MKEEKGSKQYKIWLTIIILIAIIISIFANNERNNNSNNISNNYSNSINESTSENSKTTYDINNIPKYEEVNKQEIIINNDVPYYEDKLTTEDFRIYSDLDKIDKGRAHTAFINVSKDTMPTEGSKREQLTYNPTGWHQVLYGENNKYHLYERCHLIAWSLGSQNNNPQNLITGTEQMNKTMIPYENEIRNWINQQYENDNTQKYHVMYRVTPVYDGNNLLAKGVEIEAQSVEEGIGESVEFNRFIYNVENGFEINYATGEAKIIENK